jgi:hypothetical protein
MDVRRHDVERDGDQRCGKENSQRDQCEAGGAWPLRKSPQRQHRAERPGHVQRQRQRIDDEDRAKRRAGLPEAPGAQKLRKRDLTPLPDSCWAAVRDIVYNRGR